jgi:predicted Zn-dependent protease
MKHKLAAWLLIPSLSALPLSGRCIELPDLGEASRQVFSESQERAIAASIMRDVRRDPRYLNDTETTWYLQNLGQRLAAASPDPSRRFTFFLVDDPSINAFALPGGFIGVHSGLILAAQSESELAGVVAHEIAHITQQHLSRMIAADSNSALLSLAGLAIALLAARSNPQAAQAAIIGSQAAALQSRLDYSRDHEREADRVGFTILDNAGFDTRGMADFFQRLLNVSRLYDSNAPAYLFTHPLTTERIADMTNRLERSRYRQTPDSMEFQLVRARLKPVQGTPGAVAGIEESLAQERYGSEAAARYTLVRALMEQGDLTRAQHEMRTLQQRASSHPMLWRLAATLAERQGDRGRALEMLNQARREFPHDPPLALAHAETLLRASDGAGALVVLDRLLQEHPGETAALTAKAHAHALLGQDFEAHVAQAEARASLGEFDAAVEQLRLALHIGSSDFYRMSAAEARLRELRRDLAEGGAAQAVQAAHARIVSNH